MNGNIDHDTGAVRVDGIGHQFTDHDGRIVDDRRRVEAVAEHCCEVSGTETSRQARSFRAAHITLLRLPTHTITTPQVKTSYCGPTQK
jgi:hypothetical protein